MRIRSIVVMVHIARLRRFFLAALVLGVGLAALVPMTFATERREVQSLRVAVYNVPPYGFVDSDGSMSGASVDLWRRVAGEMEWHYQLLPVSDMETILGGLEQGRFGPRRSAPSRLRRNGRRASISPIRPIAPESRSP